MTRSYQIFMTPVPGDLAQARKAVVARILAMGHIPIDMDAFDAEEPAQLRAIETRIAGSDYVLAIMAGADESEGAMAQGPARLALACAARQNLPSLVLLRDAGAKPDAPSEWPQAKIRSWRDVEHLSEAMFEALSELIGERPRQGWIRGEAVACETMPEAGPPQLIIKAAAEPEPPPQASGFTLDAVAQALSEALDATAVEIGFFRHNQYVEERLTLRDIFAKTYYSFLSGLSATDYLSLILHTFNARVVKPDEHKILHVLRSNNLIEPRLPLRPTSGRATIETIYFLTAQGRSFALQSRMWSQDLMDDDYSPE